MYVHFRHLQVLALRTPHYKSRTISGVDALLRRYFGEKNNDRKCLINIFFKLYEQKILKEECIVVCDIF